MKYYTVCVYCGNTLDDNAQYCSKCQEYDGIAVGYFDKNDEFVEVENGN